MTRRDACAGTGYEHRLNDLHALYRAQVRAAVDKIDPPLVRGRGGGAALDRHGRPIVRAAGADYRGVLAGGRAVIAEAKSRADGGTLPVSALTERELADLAAWAAMGALALVLLEVRDGAARGEYVIPAAALHGRRSVPLLGDEAAALGVVRHGGDWLAAVQRKTCDCPGECPCYRLGAR